MQGVLDVAACRLNVVILFKWHHIPNACTKAEMTTLLLCESTYLALALDQSITTFALAARAFLCVEVLAVGRIGRGALHG